MSDAIRHAVREVETPGGPGRVHLDCPVSPRGSVVLGHGAGGGLGAIDLAIAREVLVAAGWAVALVEQPWLVAGRRVAGRPPTLDAAWVPIVEALMTGRGRLPRPLVLGGRSAGARVACRTAGPLMADAALLLSFPLHPPGQPEKSRAHELALAPEPTWVVQGRTDAFGTPDEVRAHLPSGASLIEVPGGHSFPKSSRSAITDALSAVAGMLPV
ncbi:alpha/beta family hydrolase [Terrabacter sp. NPDC080008]|uniref:alpha/beta hydrolase family protein n=1 Tax=Terrabacter sp. NPDC080008 TaxID=3155176 RepID=UPI00344BD639